MSGEYYHNEDSVPKFYQDYDGISPSHAQKDTYASPRNHQLHNIEEQLELAEDRCNTLKGQLDYMKQVYGVKKSAATKARKFSIRPTKDTSEKAASISSCSLSSSEARRILPRQKSNAIGTDNSGAAVKTINNILNGITNSVNRLSELHIQISETPKSRRSRESPVMSAKAQPIPVTAPVQFTPRLGEQQDRNTESSTGLFKKPKGTKRKRELRQQVFKKQANVAALIKRPPKLERRSKCSKTSLIMENNPPNLQRRKMMSNTKMSCVHPNKLVEIYHNVAARNSDSDETNFNKRHANLEAEETKTLAAEVPPLEIPNQDVNNAMDTNRHISTSMSLKQQKPIISKTSAHNGDADYSYGYAQFFEPPEAPREGKIYQKSYAMPTISSRLKQVAKCCLQTFNFKNGAYGRAPHDWAGFARAIPFVTAISTTPSHNIGINIQQVMSIIRNRQPVSGISPTLAHNIGLAAEKLNNKPLSVLVSNINSRTSYRASTCPLAKQVNYTQLQDLAKGIPEESSEEIEAAANEKEESPVRTIIVTGPSGDMEVRTKDVPSWTVDSSKPQEECICAPKTGVAFQDIVNRYGRAAQNTACTVVSRTSTSWLSNRPQTTKRTSRAVKQCESRAVTQPVEERVADDTEMDQSLNGKEKNLKDVLTTLHNDFEWLNKRYEELSQKATSDDEETIQELEKLEHELNKKEEEITMVMALYKEVLALKQQVKVLKQKSSQTSMTQESKEAAQTFRDYNNPQAAFHLTKLLRQIQAYQLRYKKDAVVV